MISMLSLFVITYSNIEQFLLGHRVVFSTTIFQELQAYESDASFLGQEYGEILGEVDLSYFSLITAVNRCT